jgi:hypothetical protein
VVSAVANMEAETVAYAIYRDWFAKFGILAQIHNDGGKELVNKLSAELFQLLNVQHTKTSPAHPQCNAQVEVFNKNSEKVFAIFCGQHNVKLGDFLAGTGFLLAISQRLQRLLSNYYLGKRHDSLHFQMRTFNRFTTVKCQPQRDIIYCKSCDPLHINSQQNKA